ncbi:hypothetical protein L7F22_061705 [Adiantum nelumboides]|nr:hypothetical protein [Adiantum nelumboides]
MRLCGIIMWILKRSERSKRGLALSTVRYFFNITSNFDREGHSQILSMILRHPELREIVKKTMFPNQTILEVIVENMKTSLRMVKGMESVDKLAAKRVALHEVANNAGIQQYSDRRVAKALGIQPRDLKKHHADIQAKTFKWVGEGHKHRADCLSEEVVHSVILFWTSNTRVSPNKKDPLNFITEYLMQAEFFMNFKDQHPSIDIGFRAFHKLKPFFWGEFRQVPMQRRRKGKRAGSERDGRSANGYERRRKSGSGRRVRGIVIRINAGERCAVSNSQRHHHQTRRRLEVGVQAT